MTVTQLNAMLAQAATALQNNANFFTPDMLTKITNLWAEIKPLLPVAVAASALTSAELLQIQSAGDQLIEGETTLITSGETPNYIALLNGIQNRPAIEWVLLELFAGNSTVQVEDQFRPAPAPVELAQEFHEIYERLAPNFGYKTREASAKPWADVPENNKNLMTAVCAEIIAKHAI